MLFRHDTKELFVRKQDGKLYPVVWKVRAVRSRIQETDKGSRSAGGVKFTDVAGEMDIDDEGFVDVEIL